MISLLLFSCSNTNKNITYDVSNMQKTSFILNSATEIKKEAISDHQLMMSLLNRPITADQAMMLAFSQQKKAEQLSTPYFFVNAITIKGEKEKENEDKQRNNTHRYSVLISQDANAVNIMAPL